MKTIHSALQNIIADIKTVEVNCDNRDLLEQCLFFRTRAETLLTCLNSPPNPDNYTEKFIEFYEQHSETPQSRDSIDVEAMLRKILEHIQQCLAKGCCADCHEKNKTDTPDTTEMSDALREWNRLIASIWDRHR